MPLDNMNTIEPEFDPFAEHNSKPSSIMFPVGERNVGWEMRDHSYSNIASHKAIIRTSNENTRVHVLGVVGKGYNLIHNKELYGRVEDTMRKQMPIDNLKDVRIQDRVSGWGRMCYREYVFPNIECDITVKARSNIAFRMIVQNGYGGSALRLHAGAIDFFCTNGMISGEFQSTYNKHTSGLQLDNIEHNITKALETFAASQTKWARWATTPVKHEAAMNLFRELASSAKLQDNLILQYKKEAIDRGANLWSVYSALTHYASHADGDFKMRSTVEEQDTAASVMLQRELNVARWIKSLAWDKLESASVNLT